MFTGREIIAHGIKQAHTLNFQHGLAFHGILHESPVHMGRTRSQVALAHGLRLDERLRLQVGGEEALDALPGHIQACDLKPRLSFEGFVVSRARASCTCHEDLLHGLEHFLALPAKTRFASFRLFVYRLYF